MNPDWTNPSDKISNHFTVREALLLPSWGVLHVPSDDEKANILEMAAIMDIVRDRLGKPMKVHCWIRPTAANCPGSSHDGENYNLAAGSTAPKSAHIIGKAVDWDNGDDCDDVRSTLEPMLEELELRMEDRPQSNWVHLDCQALAPGGHRFFKP